MFARGEFVLGEHERADLAAERGAAARRLQLRLRVGADNKVQQVKVASASATASASRSRGAWTPRPACGAGRGLPGRRRHWCASSTPAEPASAPERQRRMMNVSAWSIRNPVPRDAVRHADDRRRDGLPGDEDPALPRHRPADHQRHGRLPGAAPAQLETEVARKIENSIATVQGLKHIYTKVQDGAATITAEFRLEKPTQEALDDVRDAVSRVRADLPADLREPIVTQVDLAGAPMLTYTVASTSMDDEALSWFVDNDVTRALLAVPGVGAVNRVGGVDARDSRRARPGAPAGARRHGRRRFAPAAPGAAGCLGRPHRRRRRRTVGAHAGHRAVRRRARRAWRSRCADGRRMRLDEIADAQRHRRRAAPAALLDGQPVVGFEVARSTGASEVEVGRRRARGARALQASTPTSSSPRPSTSSTR